MSFSNARTRPHARTSLGCYGWAYRRATIGDRLAHERAPVCTWMGGSPPETSPRPLARVDNLAALMEHLAPRTLRAPLVEPWSLYVFLN